MALIGLGSPVPRVLPNPNGAFNTAGDRYMLLFLYPIFTEVPPTPPPSDDTGGARYGGRGESGRGTYIDWSLPRKRWIDREDELFIIIEDSDYI
jgi:hypothetical protein